MDRQYTFDFDSLPEHAPGHAGREAAQPPKADILSGSLFSLSAGASLQQARDPATPQIEPSIESLASATLPAASDFSAAKSGSEFLKLAADALSDLEKDLIAGKSITLVKYLAAMGRFHHYSFNNVMLIYLQRPDATHVAGFNAWKKLGRHVVKGEKGIGIIAPMVYGKKNDEAISSEDKDDDKERRIRFKAVRVFDVSQTDGDPLPEFAAIVGEPGEHLARLRDLVAQWNIRLEYDDIPGGAEGVSRGGAITVLRGLDPAKDFSVLVHEFAHELLHKSDRRAETTKTQRETEAEAVAFVVCRGIGLDTGTHTSDYIQLYQGDAKTLSTSLDLIQKTAAEILGELLPPLASRPPAGAK